MASFIRYDTVECSRSVTSTVNGALHAFDLLNHRFDIIVVAVLYLLILCRERAFPARASLPHFLICL